MNIQDFFNSPVMRLPRDRDDEEFERYLQTLFKAYRSEIDSLDPRCHLSAGIQAAGPDIAQLCTCIQDAVRHYLSGLPQAAYNELLNGINLVLPAFRNLQSLEIGLGRHREPLPDREH